MSHIRCVVLACLVALLAACAQTAPHVPEPAPAPDAAGSAPGDPRLRGIRARDPAREEPGVGVGGLLREEPTPR
ncbi:MAG TPA: hypothetical protein PLX20_02995 [Rhodocyclaceae bacterium]|nr:hypothetical protein [Rhodocyclaceae bacterium]HMV52881.1 hypothetical protein [Rhodocyclaceae bacterium]HMZ83152.1 hypothetical protein [Rhodocyclaceae bacterium]HNA04744.1 hypothetical protein [Rhodocyclaceae bacterium]HNB79610.1 hypothetical protein [Rhodocyclaceae bacterium]